MRDTLPHKPYANECAVVNLDLNANSGTHWVAYYKNGANVEYFDSFGNLKPPKELIEYFKAYQITYNHNHYQKYSEKNCGHLCLNFLYNQVYR